MLHRKAILIALAALALIWVPGMRADSLQLKNGNFVQGKYLGGTEHAVQFVVNGKIRLYNIDEILSISFGSASADGGGLSNTADRKPNPGRRTNSLNADDSPTTARPMRVERRSVGPQEISWKQNPYRSYGNRLASNLHGAKAVCIGEKRASRDRTRFSWQAVPMIFRTSADIRD